MAVLIDTGALIEVERGAARLDELSQGELQAMSAITFSELLQGIHRLRGDRHVRGRAFVDGLLTRLEAIPITESVARVHADLWAVLRQRGEMIGAHDLWIAATAVAHDAGIVTTDVRDFSRVPGLRVLAV